MGTRYREAQEHSNNVRESNRTVVGMSGILLISVPTVFLGFPVWGSHFNPFIPKRHLDG